MNSFCGIGRLGRDAIVRVTPAGKDLLSFAVAFDVGFGQNKTTVWMDCTAWGERFAKLEPYLMKGDRVGVQGEIGTKEHNGKINVTLNVREVTLLGSKHAQENAQPPPRRQPPGPRPGDIEDDEIPF